MNAKLAVAAIGLAMISTGAAYASSAVRHDQRRVTDFELRKGQSKTIVANEQMATYRLCFERANNDASEPFGLPAWRDRDVALRVVADGQSSTIMAGNCTNLQAKNISISPAGIGYDNVLEGHVEELG